MTKDQALGLYQAFRTTLLEKNGVAVEARGADKRSCYELATHGLRLDTKHHSMLQMACQVIDDMAAALNE